ncbi:MAG: MarR family transcriptional regulator [Candidatus Latescibacteria bacterium]|nr:MarR family transcriptional regulator [Candidatus Latescibacterota bacterium]MCK5327909.1 MarR family transcriptional regulator [Candidatus Latescibacterota bacterium]MCK5526162.1 MarR family transcriptional regulator [Candidatus Latescibacterota bacterium]MCK5733374.1 MarR family transcriptional regulator [Candidatus Latescibacterota bacterium]
MPTYADYAREIMEVMKAAQKAIRARLLQQLLPHRLTIAQHNTLQHLWWHRSKGGLGIGELSEHLGLARSTVSGIVDRLGRDGWILRNRVNSDRRAVKVQLTAKGTELFEQTKEASDRFWLATVGRLTPEEQAALVQSLRRLREVMEEPDWPGYEAVHAARSEGKKEEERLPQKLEEIWKEEIRSAGIRLAMARKAEQEHHPEAAAYLSQAASEEANHALSVAGLLGKAKDMKKNLLRLVEAEKHARRIKLEAMELGGEAEAMDFLNRAAEDERRHKKWFKKLAAHL